MPVIHGELKVAINYALIEEIKEIVEREVPAENGSLVEDFKRFIAIPNYRAAFAILAIIEKNKSIKKTEHFRNLIGRFWHEVAE